MNPSREKPVNLSDTDLEGVVGGTVSGVGATNAASLQNIQSMDIETALMMVQSERTKLLDAQLQSQVQEVQNRNNQVLQLNEALSAAHSIKATFGSDAPADTVFGAGLNQTQRESLIATFTKEYGDTGTTFATEALKDGQLTKGEVDNLITQTKSMIDAAGNSQQMDMLRLQSLSNKRNEAFDVMTNFIKKMQDSRSSIIGNMR